MARAFLLVLLAVLPLPCLATEPLAGKKAKLHVLAIAFNQQGGAAHVNDYNCFPPEIEKVFREQGKDFYRQMNARQILGKQATRAGLLAGFSWLRENAGKDDLVVLYLTCHGSTHPTKGWSVETIDKKTLWGDEVKTELGKLPCQALVLLETCTSGGFAEVHKDDLPMPSNVTAICSCSAKQTTNNELDIALAEALYGRADFNGDGVIELDEVIRYIRLRYREWWPEPRTMAGSQTPIVLKAKDLKGPLPLTKTAPNLVGVVHKGHWYSALKEKQDGNTFQVHLLGWASAPGPYFLTNSVPREALCLPADGKPLLVEQKGQWFPARSLKMEGASCKVHYIGFDEQETVERTRILYPFAGDPTAQNYPYPTGTPGAWGPLGRPGDWKNTRAVTVLDERLYSIEASGALYVTDLSNGNWMPLGKPEFAGTTFLFAAGNSLYTIEKDGNLFRVNPGDGAWVRVGAKEGWKGTLAGTVHKGLLYTIDAAGCLQMTVLGTGMKKQIGKAEFINTQRMFAAGDSLYTIEKSGRLYRVNPRDGTWRKVGQAADWKDTVTATVLKGVLYTTEPAGRLFVTDLTTGKWKPIGKPEFAGSIALFAAGSKIFTIEKDGNLYWVNVK